MEVLALLVFMQPFFPAVGLVDGFQEGFPHVRGNGHAAFRIGFLLHFLELAEGAVLAHRELGAHVGGAHAAERILLRVSYIIGVMTLDVATQRTYF